MKQQTPTSVDLFVVTQCVSRAKDVVDGFKTVRTQQARDVITVSGQLSRAMDENVRLKLDNEEMREKIVQLEKKLREKK